MGNNLLITQSIMKALQSMRSVDDKMDVTQHRVTTGARVNSASDNAAYWSMSLMMKSDYSSFSAAYDAMSVGKSQVDVANVTIDKTNTYIDNIKALLTTAYEKGSGDFKKIQGDIKLNVQNIQSAIYSASLAEKNILANGGQPVEVAGGYRRQGSDVYVDVIEIGGKELNFASKNPDGSLDLTKGVLGTIFDTGVVPNTKFDVDDLNSKVDAYNEALKAFNAGDPSTSESELVALMSEITELTDPLTVKDLSEIDFSRITSSSLKFVIDGVQTNLAVSKQNVVTAGAMLGTEKLRINGQMDYVNNLMDNITKGVGSMVDADMNAESAQMTALKVQQQLGVEVLSIANQNYRDILLMLRD
ncbi:flagellin [uncultured Bartonella sp.]|uniref:flagellin N-terminal helical domain-containing protein n=1 Tax=uncultured Bartonella sp. TaxID=104108 RepID=UPI00261F53D0|nr:flagellin [uncultured Bartonella sp.]